MARVLSELLGGAALLGRGVAELTRRPRLFGLGLVPPAITSLLFVTVLVVEIIQLDAVVGALTPYAADWEPAAALLVRVVVGVALLAGSALIMVVAFGALTLAIGAPLYDRISDAVDAAGGSGKTEPGGFASGLRQSAATVAISLLGALAFFAVGLIPVVGAVVAPVGAAILGGWMLALELTGGPLGRRGLHTLRARRARLARRRARVLGFAVPTFALFAVPGVAVLVFPVATAAATLLVQDLDRAAPDS